MACPENNEKNRLELAGKIVSGWSREDLEEYAMRELEDGYRVDNLYFEEEWDNFRDSFDWSEELRESIKEDSPSPRNDTGGCHDIEQWQIEDALYGRR